jgi:hypothetical protein
LEHRRGGVGKLFTRTAKGGAAGRGVGAEDVEDVLRLRPAEQLLEAGGIFEALFEGLLSGLRRLVGVRQGRFAFEPGALLLGSQEVAQAFDALAL